MSDEIRVMFGGDGEDSEDRLCCPFCGFNYVHPLHVRVEEKGISRSLEPKEVSVTVRNPDLCSMARGSGIYLGFQCENGHVFEVEFRFHKGMMNIYAHLISESNANIPTFWRD